MKKTLIGLTMALLLCLTCLPSLYAQDGNDADKEAIRNAIVGYVDAINNKDAAAAAACWSDSGVWIGPDGQEIVGSAAIQKHMAELFAAGQMPSIELMDVNVRVIAANVATEEGHVVVTDPNGPPHKASYISIHVKTDKGWKLDSVRETVIEDASGNYIYLRELEWMIGTWHDQGEGLKVETTCEWTANRNFMLRTFQVKDGDEVQMEGTQVVGWDADRQQIRSWVFDSDGGFGTGFWSKDGNSWMIDARFQGADGTQGSSVNRFTKIDDNQFSYDSVNRVMGGEDQADVEGVVIVRAPDTDATKTQGNQ